MTKRIGALLSALMLMMGIGLMSAGSASAASVKRLPPGCSQKYENSKPGKMTGRVTVTAQCKTPGIQPTKFTLVDLERCAVPGPAVVCAIWIDTPLRSVTNGVRLTNGIQANVNIELLPLMYKYRVTVRGTYQVLDRPPLRRQTLTYKNSHKAIFFGNPSSVG